MEVDPSFQKLLVESEILSRVAAEEISVIANSFHVSEVKLAAPAIYLIRSRNVAIT
jgi:hypothetical protein